LAGSAACTSTHIAGVVSLPAICVDAHTTPPHCTRAYAMPTTPDASHHRHTIHTKHPPTHMRRIHTPHKRHTHIYDDASLGHTNEKPRMSPPLPPRPLHAICALHGGRHHTLARGNGETHPRTQPCPQHTQADRQAGRQSGKTGKMWHQSINAFNLVVLVRCILSSLEASATTRHRW